MKSNCILLKDLKTNNDYNNAKMLKFVEESQNKIKNLEIEIAKMKADNMHQVRVSNFENRGSDCCYNSNRNTLNIFKFDISI